MSKTYTFTQKCDGCGYEDSDVEYTEVVIAVGRGPKKMLDLCQECYESLMTMVNRGTLIRGARRAPKKGPLPTPEPEQDPGYCDICGRTFLNASGLRTHKGRAHKEV